MVAESSKKDMLNFFSAICLIPVIILCMRPANERRYAVTLSLMIPVILAKLGARTMTGSYNQVFLNAGAKLIFTVVIH